MKSTGFLTKLLETAKQWLFDEAEFRYINQPFLFWYYGSNVFHDAEQLKKWLTKASFFVTLVGCSNFIYEDNWILSDIVGINDLTYLIQSHIILYSHSIR